METRQITQVKAFILVLNPMQDRTEAAHQVAISTDKQALINWYENQKSEEPYTDRDRWHKVFKKGSHIEWYNPTNINEIDHYNIGINETWSNIEDYENAKGNTNVFVVPE